MSAGAIQSEAPRERPIVFSGPMVRAILEGRKTQTRRVVKPQPEPNAYGTHSWPSHLCRSMVETREMGSLGPYGARGDRLWVKEAVAFLDGPTSFATYGIGRRFYRADDEAAAGRCGLKWRSPIHCPRWACRITLEITSVRVERLQDISEEDARSEGVTPFPKDPEGDCWTDGKHRTAFEHAWNEVHGWNPNSWASNPWVWVIAFRRLP